MDVAIKMIFLNDTYLGEFHDVKKHCISYPTKSFFSVNHFFPFRIKQELLIVYSLFVSVFVSFYDNIIKSGRRSYHCRFTQSKPGKESQDAV